jgi:ELWxxDGT repeat protein
MVAVNNRIFLLNSSVLWTSDGMAAGTFAIQQAPTGIVAMASYQGELYFITHGTSDALWKTDGTAAGTVMVDQTTVKGIDNTPGTMAVANNTVYFNLSDSTHGEELWRSDGTTQGTAMVADVNPGPGNGIYVANPQYYDQPVTVYRPLTPKSM